MTHLDHTVIGIATVIIAGHNNSPEKNGINKFTEFRPRFSRILRHAAR
jgi:hypothetical protein